MNLSKLSSKHIKIYKNLLTQRGVSEATIKRNLSSLRKFSGWLTHEGYLKKDPLTISPRRSPFGHLRGVRLAPRVAFQAYRALPYFTYLNFLILLVFLTALGWGLYQQFVVRAPSPLAYPAGEVGPKRYLSFQGRLTDSNYTPIGTAVNMEFKLYDAAGTGTGTLLWESGVCSVDPDQDGIFALLLGTPSGEGYTCSSALEIPSHVFSENAEVWLETKVASETLSPRIQIATVAYALNAETLQGFPLASAGSTTPEATMGATARTVPAINPAGNLVIASDSPTIWSTSGTFGIKGQAITIQTDTGTGGNITLAPDGTGVLNIVPTSGNQIGGTVNATNSALTTGALYTGRVQNDNTGFDFLRFFGGTSPVKRFSVGALGSIDMENNLDVGGAATITGTLAANGSIISNLVPSGTRNLGSSGSKWDYLYVNNLDAFTLQGAVTGNNQTITGLEQLTVNNLRLDGNTLDSTSGNLTLLSAGELYFDDTRTGAIPFSSSDTTLNAALTQAIVDAINETYDAATGVGGVSGFWNKTSGLLFPNNAYESVAIGGTATSSAKLYFEGTTGNASMSGQLTLHASGTNYINALSGQALSLRTSAGGDAGLTDKLYISNAGNIGIGTTSPSYKLHLAGSVSDYLGYLYNSSTNAAAAGLYIRVDGSGNLLTLNANGSDIVTISPTQATFNTPTSFTSAGDVSIAYDLLFTNQTASYIKSNAPLYLEAGETFESNDLTLRTYNKGNVIVDSEAFVTNYAATVSSQLVVGTNTAPANIGGFYLTNAATYGKALAIFNQTEGADILTASSSGTTRFVLTSAGRVGIGTALPSAMLDIVGDLEVNGYATVSSSLALGTSSAPAGPGNLRMSGLLDIDGTGIHDIAGTLNLSGNALTSTGDLTITPAGGDILSAGNILPSTGNTYDLGSTGAYWNNLYVNNIYGGSSGTSGYWTKGSGVIYPNNTYESVAVGGTSTSSAKLYFEGTTGNASMSGTLTIGQGQTIRPAYGPLQLAYKSGPNAWTTGMVINESGNVGIGTTDPDSSYKLDVNGSIKSSNNIRAGNAVLAYGTGFWGNKLEATAGNDLNLYGRANLILRFDSDSLASDKIFAIQHDSGTELFRVNESGNVGIGTTNPLGALHIDKNTSLNPALIVNQLGSGNIIEASSSGTRKFFVTTDGSINSSGYATVSGSLAVGYSSVLAGTGNAAFAGKVGIGTTNPSKLLVVGSLSGTPTIRLTANTNDLGGTDANSNVEIELNADVTGSNYNFLSKIVGIGLTGTGVRRGEMAFYTSNLGVYNSTPNLYLNYLGNVGIGTTAPIAPLHVAGSYGSNAALIVDQLYSGDILTASASGQTKFTVSNSGNLTFSGSANTITNTNQLTLSTTGASSDLVLSAGRDITFDDDNLSSPVPLSLADSALNASLGQGIIDAINDAYAAAVGSGGISGFWTKTSGLLFPNNTYESVAIGGTATSSAKLYFEGTTGNASMAGTLTIGQGQTIRPAYGPLQLAYKSGPNVWTTGMVINESGNVGIGTTNPTAKFHLIQTTGGNNAQFTIGGSVTSGYTAAWSLDDTGMKLGQNSSSRDFQLQTASLTRLTILGGGNVGIGTTSPVGKLEVSGTNTGKALAIFNETSGNDIFTASVSGSPKFVITNAGNVGIGTTGPARKLDILDTSAAQLRLSSDGSNYNEFRTLANGVLDIDSTSGLYRFGYNTDTVANYAVFYNADETKALTVGFSGSSQIFSVGGSLAINWSADNGVNLFAGAESGENPWLTIYGYDTGAGATRYGLLYVDAAGDFNIEAQSGEVIRLRTGGADQVTIDNSGNVGIGNTTPVAKLEVSGTNTGKALAIFNETGGNDILVASVSGASRMRLSNAGNLGIEGSIYDISGSSLSVADNLLVYGNVIPSSGDTYDLGSTTAYWNNLYANNIYGGTGGTQGYWTKGSGLIYPNNAYESVAIGGTSTASAKLYFEGTTGNASMSGNLTLTGGGTIGATDMNNLTLGNSSTQNVIINPNGNVGIGTTAPTNKLHIKTGDSDLYSMVETTYVAGNSGYRMKNTTQEWRIGVVGSDSDKFTIRDNTGTAYQPVVIEPDAGNNLLYLKQGKVGIGTTAPTAILDIAGDASTSGSLVFRGTSPATIDILNGDDLRFQTSVGGDAVLTPRMTITNAGNVGIGTTNPLGNLHVASDNTVDDLILNTAATTNLYTNPSAETNLTNWGSWQATNSRVTTVSKYGQYSVKTTQTTGLGYTSFTVDNTVPNITPAQGETYTCSVYIITDSAWSGKSGTLIIRENGGATGAQQTSTSFTYSTSWQRIIATRTILQVDRTSIDCFVGMSGLGGDDGAYFYTDGWQAEKTSSATPYCDGSLGPGYSWTGTPHASTSVRRAGAAFAYQTINSANGLGATSRSTYPTLQIDQAGTGDIFTASASGSPKFTVSNSGNLTFSGSANTITNANQLTLSTSGASSDLIFSAGRDITFNDDNLTSAVPLSLADSALNANLGQAIIDAINDAYEAAVGSGGISGFWTKTSGLLFPNNTYESVAVGGTSTSSAKLYFEGTTGNASMSGNLALAGGGTIGATDMNNLTLGDSSTQNVIINPNGNVGIGTTAPGSYKLYVNGTSYFADNLELSTSKVAYIRKMVDPSYAASYLYFYSGTDNLDTTLSSNDDIIFDPGAGADSWFVNGNVGIGNTSPSELLDVAGDIRSTTGTLQIGNTANVAYNRLGTGTASDGDIGDASDLYLSDSLEVGGNATISGTLSAYKFQTPYEKTVTVAKSGGDYLTITDALNSLTTCTSSAPCLIQVMPGTYAEQVTMKEYVDIKGSGWEVTIIDPPSNGIALYGEDNSRISDIKIQNAATYGTAIVDGTNVASADSFYMANVYVNASSDGAGISNGYATIYDSIIYSGNGNSIWTGTFKAYNTNFSTGNTGRGINGVFSLWNCNVGGTSGLGADSYIYNSNFQYGLSLGANGNFYIYHSYVGTNLVFVYPSAVLYSYFTHYEGNIYGGEAGRGYYYSYKDTYSTTTTIGVTNTLAAYDRRDYIAQSIYPLFTVTQKGTGDIVNLFDDTTEVLTILDGGNVGIGNTTPVSKLQISGTNAGKALAIFNESGTVNDIFTASASGATKMTLSNSGNLAIEGALSDLSDATLSINDNLSVVGNIVPSAGSTYDLGSTTAYWNNLYANNIYGGTGGTQGYWTKGSGLIYPNNTYESIAIGGTSTASAKLYFEGTTGNASIAGTLTIGQGQTIRPAYGPLQLAYKSGPNAWTTGMVMTESGYVGIGTTNPGGKLEVNNGYLLIDKDYGTLGNGSNSGRNYIWGLSTTYPDYGFSYYNEASNDYLAFHPNGNPSSPVMAVTQNSRVGIGTTSPTALLDVAGDASTSGSLVFRGTSPATIDILNGDDLRFQTSVGGDAVLTPRMTITNAGNVGIGTTGPATKLHINTGGQATLDSFTGQIFLQSSGSAGPGNYGPGIIFSQADGSSLANHGASITSIEEGSGDANRIGLTFNVHGGTSADPRYEAMRISHTGNVGIGTTIPNAKLDIAQTDAANDEALIIDTEETTSTQDVFKIISDVGGDEATVFNIDANGDITSGTWKGTAVTTQYGGTGQNWSATAQGSVPYFNGIGTMDALAPSTAGYVLTTQGASANPNWTASSGLGTNYWTKTTGLLYPNNTYESVAIGGTSTASAKLYFEGTTGNASMSGQLTLHAAGTNYINTLSGQALSLRTSVGGDAGLTDKLYITNAGNVGIGTTAPSTKLHVTGGANYKGFATNTLLLKEAAYPSIIFESSQLVGFGQYGFGFGLYTRADTTGFVSGDLRFLVSDAGTIGIGGAITDTSTLAGASMVITSGNVGIGTTSPTAKLDVAGDASTSGSLVFRGTSPATIDILNGDDLRFQTSVGGDAVLTPRMTITNAGNVGIGTTGPSTPLHIVRGTAGSIPSLSAETAIFQSNQGTTNNAEIILLAGSSGLSIVNFGDDNDRNIGAIAYDHSDNSLKLRTNDTYQLTINSSGNVGIGTTDPKTKLHVNKDPISSFTGTTVGTMMLSGDVTADYFSTLDFAGHAAGARIPIARIGAQVTGAGTKLMFGTSNSYGSGITNTTMTIDYNANVGIGITSPLAPLHISKGYGSNAALIVDQLNSGDIITASASGTKMTLSNAGNLAIEGALSDLSGTTLSINDNLSVVGNIVPSAGSTYDLGSPGAYWNNLYVNNLFGGTGGTQGHWSKSNGLIYPNNTYESVAIGGTATTSAKLYFEGTTGNASMSGNLAFAGGGTIGATDMNNLTIGDSNTNNIQFYSGSYYLNPSGQLTLATNETINGIDISAGAIADLTGLTFDGSARTITNSNQLTLSTSGASSDLVLSAGRDITFDDDNLASPVPLSVADSALNVNLTQGIIDAINEAYDAAVGSGGISGFWTKTSGLLFPNNTYESVAIGGTATTSAKLYFEGTTGNASMSGNLTLAGGGTIGATDMNNLTIGDSSTQNVIINPNGKVGIGTTAPTEKLTVEGKIKIVDETIETETVTFDAESAAGLRMSNSNGYISFTPYNSGWAHFYTDRSRYYFNKEVVVDTGLISSYDENLELRADFNETATDNQLYLKTSGYIGMGTTTPLGALHIDKNTSLNPALIVNQLGSGNIIEASSSGTRKFYVTADGSLNSSGYATISGSLAAGYSSVLAGTGNAAFAGKVGIGTTNPSQKLEVASGNILLSDTSNGSLKLSYGGQLFDESSRTLIEANNDSFDVITENGSGHMFEVRSTAYNFYLSNVVKVNIDSSGNLAIEGALSDLSGTTLSINDNLSVVGNVVPSAGNTYDLGSTSAYWNNLYANNIYGGSSGTSGYWTKATGLIYPNNTYESVAIGGTATSSAKLYFEGTTGNASMSGNLTLAGGGTIGATDMNNLTIGDSSTQNIIINPNGNVGIGTTGPGQKLDVVGNIQLSGTLQGTGNAALADLSGFNILKGSSVESWSGGVSSAPNGWSLLQDGTGATIAREATIVKVGTYSAKVTTGTAATYLNQTPNNWQYYKGRKLTIIGWVNASVASKVSLLLNDGVTTFASSSYHTGDGTWQRLEASGTMSADATGLSVQCRGETGAGTYYCDGLMVTEGSFATQLAYKPINDAETNQFIGGLDNSNPILTIDQQGTADILRLNNTGINRLTVQAGGNVGIGTTNPSQKLDVAGNATISGTLALGPQTRAYAGNCDASAEGKMYYDASADKYYYCDGSTWTEMGAGAAELWEAGTYGTYEDDAAVIVGADAAFSWANGGVGDLKVADQLEVTGNARFGGIVYFANGTTYYVDASGHANLNNITGAGTLDINGAGTHDIAGTLNLSGNALTSSGDLTITPAGGDILSAGNIVPNTGNTYNLGSSGAYWNNLYANNIYGGTGGTQGYWTKGSGLIYPNNTYESVAVGGTATTSAKLYFEGTTGNASMSGDLTLAGGGTVKTTDMNPLTIGGSTTGGITIDSGTNSITLSDNTTITGLLTANGGITADGGVFTVADATGAIHTGNNLDVDGVITAGSSPVTLTGATGYILEGAITQDSLDDSEIETGGIGADSLAADSVGDSELFNGGDWIITSTLNIGTNAQALTISTDGYLVDEDDAVTVDDGLSVTGDVDLGNATSDTITATGRFDSSLVPSAGSTYDLGSSALPWNNLYTNNIYGTSTGTQGFWTKGSGVLYPNNIYESVAVGGTATSSAKLYFEGTTGNASMSGDLTLAGGGTIKTTDMNALTIGGSTTGGITIDSGTGSITLSDNTTISSDLTVSGGDITGTGDEKIDIGEATADTIQAYINATSELTLSALVLQPTTDETGLSLGQDSNEWQDLWIAGTAYLDAVTMHGAIAMGGYNITDGGTIQTNTLEDNDDTTLALNDNLSITGNVLPSAGSTYDLGSSSLPWNNAYANNLYGSSTGTQGFWTKTSGVLYPNNTYESIAVGGTSTTSAKLLFSGPTGNASMSGTLTLFGATPAITTTNRRSLTLGDASTGNIVIYNDLQINGSEILDSNGIARISLGSTTEIIANLSVTQNLTVDTDTFFVDASTNRVGIGTTDPQAKLDIAGANSLISNSSGDITLDAFSGYISFSSDYISNLGGIYGDLNVTGNILNSTAEQPVKISDWTLIQTSTPSAALMVDQTGVGDIFTASTSGVAKFVIKNNGYVGIGTTAPAAGLHLYGDAAANIITERSSSAGSVIGFKNTDSTIYAGMSPSENFGIGSNTNVNTNPWLYIESTSGNVGIGTTAPSDKLHVIGNTTIASSSDSTDYFQITNDGTWTTFNRTTDGGTTGNAIQFDSGGTVYFPNYVGIGTSGPTIDLAIGDTDTGLNQVSDGVLQLWTNNGPRIHITSGGNVGIGTTTGIDTTVEVAGSMDVSSTVRFQAVYDDTTGNAATVYVNSAGRLYRSTVSALKYKDNVRDLEFDLNKLMSFRPVKYEMSNKTAFPGETDIGLVAEEVNELYPEIVTFHDVTGEIEGLEYAKLGIFALQLAQYNHNQLQKESDNILALQSEMTSIEQQLDLSLTDTGDLNIQKEGEEFVLKDSNGNLITRVEAFGQAVIAQLKAGLIQTQELIADSLVVNQKIVSPVVETNQLTADSIQSTESKFGKLLIENEQGETVASIDSAGNASFGGLLASEELIVSEDATIAGTLYAQEIVTEKGTFGELLARVENLESFLTVTPTLEPTPTPSDTSEVSPTPSAVPSTSEVENLDSVEATDSGLLADSETWPISDPSDDVQITDSLTVLGTSSLADTSVAGQLMVDATIIIDRDGIQTLPGSNLKLQAYGWGGIDMLDGKVVIDTEGNVLITGELIAKKITTGGLVLTENTNLNECQTNPNECANESGFGKLLSVLNKEGLEVASIDASGSAFFASLGIEADYTATQSGAIIAAFDNYYENGYLAPAIKTNATAGIGILPAYEEEVMIYNPQVTGESLIYVTATTNTENKVLYVKAKKAAVSQTEPGWFIVALNESITKDIQFNWWIIDAKTQANLNP